MIVSHRHRFIFAAVPKTGTHSVRQALREHLGPEDIEQVGLFVNKRFPYPELAAIRHPFARFVSYCAFRTRDSDIFLRNPHAVMEQFLFLDPPETHILFQPQHTVLADADGRLLADMVCRVEDMQASYDAACARIGIPSQPLERVNGTRHGDHRQYYTPVLRQAVADRYARDLELFGYEF